MTPWDKSAKSEWWMLPLPVICLMVVLIVFIQNYDWRSTTSESSRRSSGIIASGVLYSVKYDGGGGKVQHLTRGTSLDDGVIHGEWNLDLHATLTKDALIIQRLKRYEKGVKPIYDADHPQVIPYDRIYDVRFGDLGITMPKPQVAGEHVQTH